MRKKTKNKPKSNWKKLSPEQIRNVIMELRHGTRKSKIIRMFKIPESQFYNILKSSINKNQ